MKIAIPTAEGKLAMHFGHCENFVFVNVEDGLIQSKTEEKPPPHEPGVLPKFLSEKKVDIIIAGGMGQRAQTLFTANNIKVIVGAPSVEIDILVQQYIDGKLETGQNLCDH